MWQLNVGVVVDFLFAIVNHFAKRL